MPVAASMDDGAAYRKLSHLEHIKERPDTYVGSVVPEASKVWVYDEGSATISEKEVVMAPGLYKCVDELLVNAIDQAVVDTTLDTIKVDVDKDGGKITVSNNGKGMPVVVHKDHGIYVPELVFGHLLTSSNYDDTEERIVGGRNGYGAKLANVFSKEFRVTVTDPERGLKYVQLFENGMTLANAPKVTIKGGVKGGVTIEYVPDLDKFGMQEIDDAFVSLLKRRALDACACVARRAVKIYFNGQRLAVKGLEEYVDLFIGPKKETPRAIDLSDDRWKICVAASSNGFKAISFVNGVFTPLGGTHVEHVVNQICKRVADLLGAKAKIQIRPTQVRDNIMVFVMATVPNPTFSSQTKEACNSKIGRAAYVLPDAVVEKVANKLGIADDILAQAKLKEAKVLNKTDGTKTTTLKGIQNLEDAINAGTSKSQNCTLILTEGLSARTFAISGLSILGRDNYGVFPLKGKLLNLRNASTKQAANNAEFGHIKRIMGLKQDTKYDTLKQLRYGRVMILADADVDGIHIRGLCMNVIEHFWPELVRLGLCCTLKTPIVKATKNNETKSFFTLREFEDFKRNVGDEMKRWTTKYYKVSPCIFFHA